MNQMIRVHNCCSDECSTKSRPMRASAESLNMMLQLREKHSPLRSMSLSQLLWDLTHASRVAIVVMVYATIHSTEIADLHIACRLNLSFPFFIIFQISAFARPEQSCSQQLACMREISCLIEQYLQELIPSQISSPAHGNRT